ncbi:MAG: molybdenum cofactor biosynthesis protein MoaE, partial [Acidimicrobiia bacterium]|nr:molybdenum cofactor biosynthesis protein MoaE [Acidimicrobiia bacterium]
RNHSPGKSNVDHLEYEAYAEQVTDKISGIIAEARREWDVLHVVAQHRVGVVAVRGVSVLVAVSSVHRGDAFNAARYIIDELKKRVPIWKKEHWPGGADWVEGA